MSQTSTDASLPAFPPPLPALVRSQAAAEAEQVIALSQDLMKHKSPTVHGGLIGAAFQTHV